MNDILLKNIDEHDIIMVAEEKDYYIWCVVCSVCVIVAIGTLFLGCALLFVFVCLCLFFLCGKGDSVI